MPAENEHESAVRAHAAHYSALATRDGPGLNGGGAPDGGARQKEALGSWRVELENINAALEAACERGDENLIEQIAEYLFRYLDISGAYASLRVQYQDLWLAAQPAGHARLRIHTGLGLGMAQFRLGQPAAARTALNGALEAAREIGDQVGEAAVLSQSATVIAVQGEFDEAEALYGRALALQRAAGERHGEAAALNNLSNIQGQRGRHAAAAELCSAALEIFRELGDLRHEAGALANLAQARLMLGDLSSASELQEQALAIKRELGDRGGEANSLGNLANVALAQDDLTRATRLYSESLALKQQIGNRHGEADALANLACVLTLGGDLKQATNLHAKALALRCELGDKTGLVYSCAFAGALLALQASPYAAVVALHGALLAAERIGYVLEPQELPLLDAARAEFERAISAGEITAEELDHWKVEGEELSLDELARFTLSALRDAASQPGAAGAASAGA